MPREPYVVDNGNISQFMVIQYSLATGALVKSMNENVAL